jgi:hypothetical protein
MGGRATSTTAAARAQRAVGTADDDDDDDDLAREADDAEFEATRDDVAHKGYRIVTTPK